MTLAIREKEIFDNQYSSGAIFSILFVHVLHLWSTPLWKGIRISFEAMEKRSYTLRMEKWQSWSIPKSQNCTRDHRELVEAAQVPWEMLVFLALCPHCNPCHPQTWGPSALPSWQSWVLYTTAAECPQPRARDSCDQVTADSAHLRLARKGPLLECLSSNRNLSLQEHHTPLTPFYEWNQAAHRMGDNSLWPSFWSC